ncbi:MAG: UbiA family prenyltransferase [Bacteroidales bacterium]|nr:UbiA family prenyltransferase [Bacteroidales bacterium]
MSKLKDFLSLVKFSHTVFALPFALFGFAIATFHDGFDWSYRLLILVLLDMIFARNAAMAFNRYIDRHIDAKNERTEIRDIPAGKISSKTAFWFVVINIILFFVTTFFINTLTFYLAPVAMLVVLGYSYTKRFTPLCHLVLGAGLALAPIGAYLAVSGVFSQAPLLLSFAVFFWVSGFDIIYALQDEEFDRQQNLKSIPVLLGARGALRLSLFFHLITFVLLFYLGSVLSISYLYWFGFSVFSALLFYQHTLVSPKNLSKVNLAFFTTNGIASVIFGGLAIVDTLLY